MKTSSEDVDSEELTWFPLKFNEVLDLENEVVMVDEATGGVGHFSGEAWDRENWLMEGGNRGDEEDEEVEAAPGNEECGTLASMADHWRRGDIFLYSSRGLNVTITSPQKDTQRISGR